MQKGRIRKEGGRARRREGGRARRREGGRARRREGGRARRKERDKRRDSVPIPMPVQNNDYCRTTLFSSLGTLQAKRETANIRLEECLALRQRAQHAKLLLLIKRSKVRKVNQAFLPEAIQI